MYIFPFEFGKKAANTVELSSKKKLFLYQIQNC